MGLIDKFNAAALVLAGDTPTSTRDIYLLHIDEDDDERFCIGLKRPYSGTTLALLFSFFELYYLSKGEDGVLEFGEYGCHVSIYVGPSRIDDFEALLDRIIHGEI